MISIEKQRYHLKYQHYHLEKNYKYEYLAGEEVLSSNQRQIIENAKNKQKKVDAIKSVDLFNKKDELKQIEGIFPQHLMNDLIRPKLKRSR